MLGLSASAVTFLFATWTLYAFSGADDREPNITLKRPNAAVVNPALTFGEQVQKTASRYRDMSSRDAAESASSSSKPAATTSKKKSFADKDPAPASDSHLPDRAMLSDRVDRVVVVGNLRQATERVEANKMGGPSVREKKSGRYARAPMERAGEIVEPSSADAEWIFFKVKTPSFTHKVRWPQETLYSIALWYTGSGEYWRKIAAANPSIAPDQIHIGNAIAIPLSLIKTREPMPLGFLKNREKSRETPATRQQSTPLESPPWQLRFYSPAAYSPSE